MDQDYTRELVNETQGRGRGDVALLGKFRESERRRELLAIARIQ